MKSLINNLKFTWKYAKNQKNNLIIYLLINIIMIAFSIITPILGAKRIVALTSNSYEQLLYVSVLILILSSLENFLTYIARIISNKIYRNTLSFLEIELSKSVLKIENKCLDKNGSGLFIQRLTSDTSKMADAFNRTLEILSDVITYIGILLALLTVNKILFIYLLVTLSILTILENLRVKQRNKDDKATRKANEKVTGFIGELVRGARDIKMLNSENDFINELSNKIENSNDKRFIMNKHNYIYRLFNWALLDVFNFLLLVILLILMKDKFLSSAAALIVYNYAGRLRGSIFLVGNIMEYIKEFNLSVERVHEIIEGEEFKKEKFGDKHLDKVEGNFEFKNVEFSYGEEKILKGINFKINANETVAFVGKSETGKTTIFNLLCKMYDPTKGKILIDGNDIKKLDKESIRGNITIISQDPYILIFL